MKRTSGILSAAIVVVLLAVTASTRASSTATYTVTTTANSGAGSLRQAILDANANPGADTITFAIGSIGSQQTISPTAALPTITDPIVIDGWSQGGAGYSGPPLIELNGALAGNHISGLTITGGGSAVRGLVINGFFLGSFASGIRLQTGGGNWIYGNYIGTDFAGATRVANNRGIWIDGGSSNNRIGTNADGVNDVAERNVISANVEQNIWIYQPATTGNKIMGNYIGLNAAGTAAMGTNNQTVAAAGILVQEASYTVIGTDGDGQGDALEGNVVSGSILNINLTGTSNLNESNNNRISGNRIGTNASGTASVGIQAEGVRVYVAYDNLIGTDGDGVSDEFEGNLISGNIDFGVMLQQTGSRNTIVAGNKIGTDITGMVAIPNGTISSPRAGILLGGYGNRIGTNSDGVSDDLERNLISGNTNVSTYAIYFNNLPNPGAPPTIIAGNWMGVDATGLAALPNNVGIGGTSYAPTTIRDNVISGNTYEGISTHSSNMLITGSRIGVGADGVTPLGNGYNGIYLSGNDNIIGGAGPGEGNIIAHNGYSNGNYPNGIRVSNNGLRNSIRGNYIYANSLLGIDLLWPAGVNINDLGDGDTGGNNLQNYPVLTAATSFNASLIVTGMLNSTANLTFTLDFYSSSACDNSGYGEGEVYLGAGQVTTDANGDAAFTLPVAGLAPSGHAVSATATDPDGNTSEFSACIPVVGDEPISNLQASNNSPTQLGQPTQLAATLSSGTGVSYVWDFGDGAAGAGANPLHLYPAVGAYTATVTATNILGTAVATTPVTILPPPTCTATPDDGDTVYGSGDETAVQQAINTATPGSTVKIAGTCTGVGIQGGAWQTIYIDTSLTLAGGYAVTDWTTPDPVANPTTLDAQNLGRVVFIADTVPVTLTNLTLINGNFSGSGTGNCPGYGCGGGLYTWGDLSLTNVIIQDSQTRRGGGAYVLGALAAVDTNWLKNTGTNQRGGALEVYGDATITGGLVQGNAATVGGGLFANAALAISGTHFISNTATSTGTGSGGAIYSAGALTLINARFERNTSYTGAGAVLHSPGTNEFLSISHTQFISNTTLNASAQGGALYASATSTIHASTFQGNSAPGSGGAGGALVAFRAITLTNTSLISNTAGSQGGAIYHWGLNETGNTSQVYPLMMADSLLAGNQAGAEGGGLYFRRGFAANNTPVQFLHMTLDGNTAVLAGGGAYLGQPADIAGSILQHNQSTSAAGGGLYTEDRLNLAQTTFEKNSATHAGGAYVIGDLIAVDSDWLANIGMNQRGGALEVYGDAAVAGGLVQGNMASYGGGFFADAGLVISGTQFISNTATSTGAGSGGAIYAAGPLELSSALFEGNRSYTGAGAVLHSPGTNEFLFISNTQFINNTTLNTSAQGGALYAGGGSTIAASTFQGNSAPGSGGAGGAIVAFRAITLTNTLLISNTAGSQGGAIYHWGLSETGNTSQIYPLVVADSLLADNSVGAEGGGLYFRLGFAANNFPVTINDSTFRANTAVLNGGGAYFGQPAAVADSTFADNASLTGNGGGLFAGVFLALDRSTLIGNHAAVSGSGLALQRGGSFNSRMYNAVFANNSTDNGGAALHISGSNPLTIFHMTLVGANTMTPGLVAEGAAVEITNAIIVSHTIGIVANGGVAVTADHSLFFGNQTNVQGVTNLNPVMGDPRFLDAAGGDFHLALGSAAVDVAKEAFIDMDWEGDLRPIIASPDIGADEFGDSAVVEPTVTTTMTSTVGTSRQIIIIIPPGALGGTGTIRLLPIITPTRPLPPQRPYANLGFMLQTQLDGGLRLAHADIFSMPITIELQYTDADVIGLNEAALDLLVWDEIAQTWITAQDTCASVVSPVRQIGSNRLIVTTCAEGEFVLARGPYQLYLPLVMR